MQRLLETVAMYGARVGNGQRRSISSRSPCRRPHLRSIRRGHGGSRALATVEMTEGGASLSTWLRARARVHPTSAIRTNSRFQGERGCGEREKETVSAGACGYSA